jgi:hypothetical protein
VRLNPRSDSRQVHADDPVSPCSRFLRGPRKTVESLDDADIVEPRRLERRDKLCFQQSTGDSTCPQVDIAPLSVRQFLADDDVGDLHAPPRLQNAGDLPNRAVLQRDKIQHAV